jgi:uncharacterized protein
MNPPPQAPSFCSDCGVPISAAGQCARCTPAQQAAPSPSSPHATSAKADAHSEHLPKSRSGLRSALGLYFTLLGVIMVFTIAHQVMGEEITPEWEVGADVLVSFVFGAVVLGAAYPLRRSIVPLLTRLGHPAWMFAAPCIAMATCLLASLIVNAINSMFSVPEQTYIEPFMLAGVGLWLPLITIAVCPAVFEEIAFRGVISSALDNVLDARDAALVTALLFAILHLSVLSFPHLLVMGLVLGYVRHRSGSLYPCILLHFCHNAAVVLIEYSKI